MSVTGMTTEAMEGMMAKRMKTGVLPLLLVALSTMGCIESNPLPSPEGGAEVYTSRGTDAASLADVAEKTDGAIQDFVAADADAADLVEVDVDATDGADQAGEPDACQPECEGKECGDDGCGGSCGQCPQDQECLPEGICAFVDYPDCEGKECGPDGYGGTCGECEEGFECTPAGKCEAPCIGEGESLGPEEEDVPCCEGLTALPHFKTNPGDDCEDMECCFSCDPMEDSVCGACGDGVCGPGENACNCEDCPCYPLLDSDGDGVVDEDDNCPDHYNPNQANCDKDMMGDACDPDDDNDLTEDQYDCAPCDATIFPGAVEKCNGEDDDCDDLLDEGFFSDLGDWCDPPAEPDGCDPFAEGHWECSDDGLGLVCVPNAFPGGVEICDGIDNNCNGQVDEGYPDTDMDGLADCLDPDDDNDGVDDADDNCPTVGNPDQKDCDGNGIGFACDEDVGQCDETPDEPCDPLHPEFVPGAQEICDGFDNNCNGETDEGFPDSDGDGIADCVDLD